MTTKKSLIIVGGGGFCHEVLWLASECPSLWEVKGILDDSPEMQGKSYRNVPVLGTVTDWDKFTESWFVVAIGSPRTRKKVVEKMLAKGPVQFASLIHPLVPMSKSVIIGKGSIITAGCVITTDITLGMHTVVNLLTSIGHDFMAGDYCTIAPHVAVSGHVTVGAGVEIGTGAVLIQGLTLGSGSFIGAGAVVTKNIPENVLAVGCPAKQVKSLEVF